jgi:hypothetical protein
MAIRFFGLKFVIVILIIVNAFILWKLKASYNLISKTNLVIKNNNGQVYESLEYERDSIEYLELISLDTFIPIDSIIKVEKKENQSLLVFRFSMHSCNSCVDSIFTIIKGMPENLKSNVLIVSDHESKRRLFIKLHYYKMEQVKYAVLSELSIPFDKQNIPYFFVVNNDLKISMFFIPIIKNRRRTVNYLNYVIEKHLLN